MRKCVSGIYVYCGTSCMAARPHSPLIESLDAVELIDLQRRRWSDYAQIILLSECIK